MNDPLAELLTASRWEAAGVLAKGEKQPEALTLEEWDGAQAEWLRANRERVLRALGGIPGGWASTATHCMWVFPLESGA